MAAENSDKKLQIFLTNFTGDISKGVQDVETGIAGALRKRTWIPIISPPPTLKIVQVLFPVDFDLKEKKLEKLFSETIPYAILATSHFRNNGQATLIALQEAKSRKDTVTFKDGASCVRCQGVTCEVLERLNGTEPFFWGNMLITIRRRREGHGEYEWESDCARAGIISVTGGTEGAFCTHDIFSEKKTPSDVFSARAQNGYDYSAEAQVRLVNAEGNIIDVSDAEAYATMKQYIHRGIAAVEKDALILSSIRTVIFEIDSTFVTQNQCPVSSRETTYQTLRWNLAKMMAIMVKDSITALSRGKAVLEIALGLIQAGKKLIPAPCTECRRNRIDPCSIFRSLQDRSAEFMEGRLHIRIFRHPQSGRPQWESAMEGGVLGAEFKHMEDKTLHDVFKATTTGHDLTGDDVDMFTGMELSGGWSDVAPIVAGYTGNSYVQTPSRFAQPRR